MVSGSSAAAPRPVAYFCVKAFSETDRTYDLKKFDVPTLVRHEQHRDGDPINLTDQERAELEGLARSTKSEHRMRQRARIVLLAAGGMATRAIARDVGRTIGTASKWRVR